MISLNLILSCRSEYYLNMYPIIFTITMGYLLFCKRIHALLKCTKADVDSLSPTRTIYKVFPLDLSFNRNDDKKNYVGKFKLHFK